MAFAAVSAVSSFCTKFAASTLKHIHLVDVRPGIIRLYQKEMQRQVTNGLFAVRTRYSDWQKWFGDSSVMSTRTASDIAVDSRQRVETEAVSQKADWGAAGTDVDKLPSYRLNGVDSDYEALQGDKGGRSRRHDTVSRGQADAEAKRRQESEDRKLAQVLQDAEGFDSQTMPMGRGRGRGKQKQGTFHRPGPKSYAGAVADKQTSQPSKDASHEPMDTEDSPETRVQHEDRVSRSDEGRQSAGHNDALVPRSPDGRQHQSSLSDVSGSAYRGPTDLPGVHASKADSPTSASGYTTSSDAAASGSAANRVTDDTSREKVSDSAKEDDQKVQSDDDPCSICLETPNNPVVLEKCKHVFCKACIEESFRKMQPKCPNCGVVYGALKGTQPENGTMTFYKLTQSLPGYEGQGCIEIHYSFPNGVQTVSLWFSVSVYPQEEYKSMYA